MFSENQNKILNLFFEFPSGKFHIRDISRRVELNPNTVLNIVNQLVKDKLLIREKKPHLVEIRANIDEKFIRLKRIYNLNRIYENGFIEFLMNKFSPESISLIGSYSRGEDVEESDIEIVIITKKEYETLSLLKFESKLKRKIHLIISDYKKLSDEFYINLINGIVLEGYLNKR